VLLSALFSELGLILLTAQVVRGSVLLLHQSMPFLSDVQTFRRVFQTNVISVTSGGQLNRTGAVTPRPTVVYNQVFATRYKPLSYFRP